MLAWQTGIASGRGHRVIGRRILAGLTAAALVASLAAAPVAAGTSTITAPQIVYTGVNQTVDFTGSDPISGEPRKIEMDAAISGSCDPSAGNDYSISLCGRVQLTLNDAYGGSLVLPGSTQVTTSQGVRYQTVSGAIAENPTDPSANGGVVFTINMNGTLAQLNGALADLQYAPAADYEDGTYNEVTPPGPGTPSLNILVNDGSLSATNANAQVILRVEGPNGGPTVAAPAAPLAASAGADNAYPPSTSDPALFSVVDPELCLRAPNNRCDGAFDAAPAPLLPEPNDAMLLVMWLTENSCGQFELRSTSGFANFGGGSFTSVNDILTDAAGLDLEQDAANAILATLGTAGTIDLSAQSGGLTTVFAATAGSIADVRYALSQITYRAPADDATCNLNIAFSDLGNNGMPTAWDPTPVHEIPNAKADTASVTFNVSDTQPAVAIDQISPSQAGDPAGPNKPSGFKISFDEAIDPASFDVSDLSLSTSSATGAAFGTLVPVSPGLVYTVPATATGDGTITLEMAAGAACAAGHFSGSCDGGFGTEAPAYDDNEITWDQTGPAPAISVKAGQDNPTGDATVTFEVDAGETFSSAPAGFTGADIDLTASSATTGSPTVTWQGVGSPSMFDVSVPVSSSGDVVARVMADAYLDTALNGNTASGTATVTVDQDSPTLAFALASGQASPTSTSPIALTVTFSEPVIGFDGSDVSFAGSTAGGTLVASVSGGPTVYDVLVSGMTTSGDVVAGASAGAAQDAVGNGSDASNTATVTWQQVVDATKPDVTIDQAAGQADPTGTGPIEFDVVFSEPVSGFTGADIDFTGSTAAGTLVAAVSGGPASYAVSVTGMTGEGALVVAVPAGAAQDAAANTSNASSSSDASVTFDNASPSVTIEQAAAQPDPTSTSPILFTITFSEPVTGVTASDIAFTGSTAGGSLAAAVSGGPTTYAVSVTGMTTTGTVVAAVTSGAALDAAANPSAASTSTDNEVTWNAPPPPDTTAPTVTVNQAAAQADPNSGSSILFDVVFSEPVTGFNAGDLAVTSSAGSLTADVQGGPAAYTVTLTGMSQTGLVTLAVVAGAAQDAAANPSSASTSTDASVQWNAPAQPDNTPPTVTVDQGAAQADPTSAAAIVFDVQFSEPVVGFATGDVTLGGTAGATTATVSGSGAAYTVTVTGMSQTGTVTASVAASKATDGAGNPNTASTSTDGSVQWNAPAQPDLTPPTATIDQGASQADPTSASAIVFDVVFSEAVLGFATGDVTLGGTAGATSAAVSGSGATYTVTITGMQQTGTVSASVAAGVATDTSLNPNTASSSSDNHVQWNAPAQPDLTPPTVTINQGAAQADPTSTSPILFTVVFSEPVLGFATGDVTIGGTAAATTATVSGGPTQFSVSVSGMTQTGTITASIGAAVATDGAGNPNGASTSTDGSVQWNAPPPPDTTKPTVTIEQASGQQDPAYGQSVKFTVTFSEAVTGFGPGDVSLGGTAGPTSASISVGPTANAVPLADVPAVYTVAVSGMTKKGTVTIAIAAGTVLDLSGNPNVGSTAIDGTVAWLGVRPVPSVSVPPTDSVQPGEPLAPAQAPLFLVILALIGAIALLARPPRRRPTR